MRRCPAPTELVSLRTPEGCRRVRAPVGAVACVYDGLRYVRVGVVIASRCGPVVVVFEPEG